MKNNINLQYIAGLFDGEGSIGIYARKDRLGGFHLRTQFSQNKNKEIKKIFSSLKKKFGGNLSEQKTLSGNLSYNWQLNANLAVKFLKHIKPYLILKKLQAECAINWQKKRPKQMRDNNGRIQPYTKKQINYNQKAVKLLKLLKKKG